MLAHEDIPGLFFHGVFFVFGAVGNIFIITVNCTEWVKSSIDLYSLDIILVSLAVTNILHLCIYLACTICRWLWVEIYKQDQVHKFFLIVMSYLCCCSILFTTVLLIYFYVKILNINNPSFMRFKVKFPGTVPWLLLGCVLIFVASCVVILTTDLLLKTKGDAVVNTSIIVPSNASEEYHSRSWALKGCLSIPFTIIAVVGSLCMAMLTFFTVAILNFICTHMRRMRHNENGFLSTRLNAYCGAMRTITLFFTLYVLMFISQWLVKFNDVIPETPGYLIETFLFSSFPAFNSLIIILGNSKLRKTLTGLIYRVRCCKGDTS
ncbi:taste receptor type 2 member 7-like [Pleurodeles waltl]|uniref:taste receptor type 2 member 7-like n=1 Tax=Pleurodeles waltl TaxID=8319 RepID=UPI0037098173